MISYILTWEVHTLLRNWLEAFARTLKLFNFSSKYTEDFWPSGGELCLLFFLILIFVQVIDTGSAVNILLNVLCFCCIDLYIICRYAKYSEESPEEPIFSEFIQNIELILEFSFLKLTEDLLIDN